MSMKFFLSLCLLLIVTMNTLAWVTYAGERFPDNEPVLTNDINDVAGEELRNVDDPFRDWSFALTEWLNGVYNEEIEDTGTAWERTTNYIKWILNYILGIIGLVALIYLIFQWFRAFTAGSNEEEMSKAWKWIRYAVLAIVGVGLAWFVLSLVFWLIQTITN